MNMALKTTIHEGRPTVLSREIMRLLSDMNEEFVRCVAGTETQPVGLFRSSPSPPADPVDALTIPIRFGRFQRSPESLSEIIVKTANDYWVVGKRSEQREFYVVLLKKDATLLDVQGTHCNFENTTLGHHRPTTHAPARALVGRGPPLTLHPACARLDRIPSQRKSSGYRQRSLAASSWTERV